MSNSTQKSKIRPVMLAVGSSVALSLATMACASSVVTPQATTAQLKSSTLAKGYNVATSTDSSTAMNTKTKVPKGKCKAGQCATGKCGGKFSANSPAKPAANASSQNQTASNAANNIANNSSSN